MRVEKVWVSGRGLRWVVVYVRELVVYRALGVKRVGVSCFAKLPTIIGVPCLGVLFGRLRWVGGFWPV